MSENARKISRNIRKTPKVLLLLLYYLQCTIPAYHRSHNKYNNNYYVITIFLFLSLIWPFSIINNCKVIIIIIVESTFSLS